MPAFDGDRGSDSSQTAPYPYDAASPPPPGYPYSQAPPGYPYAPVPQGNLPDGEPRLPGENTPRYVAVGQVPWTLAQTLAGAAITLVPWLLVLGLTATTSSGSSGFTKPLPRAADLLGGIFFFLFSAFVECAFLLVPLYFTLWRRAPGTSRQEALRALGFRRVAVGRAAGWVMVGLTVSLVATLAYGVLVQLLHLNLQTNGDALAQEAKYAPLTVLGALLAAVLIAPICEEIFFRGFLFGGLLRGMTMWPALALSALLFAVAHFDIGSFVPLLVFGLVLAFARSRLGSIWPGTAMHILNNALTSLVIVVAILHP